MQFTDGVGISGTAAEIGALCAFCADEGNLATVAVKVDDGSLVSWATNGCAAAYHHGESFDGKGSPSRTKHEWQISADWLRTVRRSMKSGDEVILRTDAKKRVVEAVVREIETSSVKLRVSLDDQIAEQISIDLPMVAPSRPGRHTGEIPTSELMVSWHVLQLLGKVTRAVDSSAIRLFVSSDPTQPIYCEVDVMGRMYDDEAPRWVVVLMPLNQTEKTE
jgi:hypothetical protein